jgi:erythromycin esterase
MIAAGYTLCKSYAIITVSSVNLTDRLLAIPFPQKDFEKEFHAMPTLHESVVSWIQENAISLSTLEAQAPLDDVLPLEKVIGHASIVGLGEATHGAHEFFTMKHRILRFLVENMGFTMFAMEMSWMGAEAMNDYIQTGRGDAKALLKKNGYGLWITYEVLELIEWMRSYNANPDHLQKISFAGFDSVNVEERCLEKIRSYFQMVDPQREPEIADLYTDVAKGSLLELPPPPVRQQNLEGAQQVYQILKDHEHDYRARSSSHAFIAILQEARVVVQAAIRQKSADLDFSSAAFRAMCQQRDHFMAENVAWLHEQTAGGAKMVLWAHNWHIGTFGKWIYGPKDDHHPFAWMGLDLRQRYQEQYLAIGFSFHEGAHSAVPVDQDGNALVFRRQPCPVKPALAGSYHELLAQAGHRYLLDLRSAPPGVVETWLKGPHPFRSFDATYNSEEKNAYQDVPLSAWFDAIIEIHTISPSQMLPKP